ncbi:MAG: hypothetical protein ABI169_15865 [Chitinophagaceae bacterium]
MSETGHAINIAHFSDLIIAVELMSNRYNPSNVDLQVPALRALRDQAKGDLKSLGEAKTTQSNASNTRNDIFEGLDTLTRRVQSSAKSAGADSKQLDDMEETARKIKGDRAGTKNPESLDPEEPKSISVSQQSYINLAAHLEGLITTISQIEAYKPNEDELRIVTLQSLQERMVIANTAVSSANFALSTARSSRNHSMYSSGKGLVAIAGLVKDYVFSSSDQGAKNPDYTAIKGIAFSQLRK